MIKDQKQNSSRENGSIKEILMQVANSFFSNFLAKFQEGVKAKVGEFLQQMKKLLAISFLIVFGVAFVFIGAAMFVDEAIGAKGSGFLLVGLILALIGFIINIFKKR